MGARSILSAAVRLRSGVERWSAEVIAGLALQEWVDDLDAVKFLAMLHVL
jgi:hypothetical protein